GVRRRGRPAHDHRSPRTRGRRRQPVHLHAAGHRLPGHRGPPHRPRGLPSSPEEYKERYPLTWPLAQRFGRRSWAFLPLTVSGRTMGTWMAAFTYPVAFTPDERSVLPTVARMLAQALSRAGTAESER